MSIENDVDYLIVDEIESVLLKICEKLDIKHAKLTFRRGSPLGDNYLGEIVDVSVEGTNDLGEKVVKKLILKCSPKNEDFRSLFPIHETYLREIFIYEKVFPQMLKIQEKNNNNKGEIFNPFALCYGTIKTEGCESIVMKNMKSEEGYLMKNRKECLDYNHALLTIRSYGKLHALSFALKDQQPEQFEIMKNYLKNNIFNSFKNMQPDYYENMTKETYEFLEGEIKEKFDKFRKQLKEILDYELSEEAAGDYAVIGHGDSWINNILYKYKEDDLELSKPTNLIFLDWQLSSIYSPVVDLFYFIFVSTDRKFRELHFDNLMDEYYESFSTILSDLGSDPKKLFPRIVFDEHLKRFMGYGIYMTIVVLRLMLSEKDEIADFKNFNKEQLENVNSMFEKPLKRAKNLQERLQDVLIDAKNLNYVNLQ